MKRSMLWKLDVALELLFVTEKWGCLASCRHQVALLCGTGSGHSVGRGPCSCPSSGLLFVEAENTLVFHGVQGVFGLPHVLAGINTLSCGEDVGHRLVQGWVDVWLPLFGWVQPKETSRAYLKTVALRNQSICCHLTLLVSPSHASVCWMVLHGMPVWRGCFS